MQQQDGAGHELVDCRDATSTAGRSNQSAASALHVTTSRPHRRTAGSAPDGLRAVRRPVQGDPAPGYLLKVLALVHIGGRLSERTSPSVCGGRRRAARPRDRRPACAAPRSGWRRAWSTRTKNVEVAPRSARRSSVGCDLRIRSVVEGQRHARRRGRPVDRARYGTDDGVERRSAAGPCSRYRDGAGPPPVKS